MKPRKNYFLAGKNRTSFRSPNIYLLEGHSNYTLPEKLKIYIEEFEFYLVEVVTLSKLRRIHI